MNHEPQAPRVSKGWKMDPAFFPILGKIVSTFSAGVMLAQLVGCSHGVAAKVPPPPAMVTVAPVEMRDVPLQLTAIGRVIASSTVSVKSQQKGELQKVGFREGDAVKAGDLIFTIDPRPYDVLLEQAKANLARDQALLEKSERDLQRGKDLVQSDSIPQATVDQYQADVDVMKATISFDESAIDNANVQLQYCYIRTPINGRMGTLMVNEGNMIKDIDTILAIITQTQPIYVEFSLPEQNLPEIRENMAGGTLAVEARFPQKPDMKREGTLQLINNQVDTSTGTILLRAVFPNEDEALWPGQFVNAVLTLRTRKDALLVPSSAIQIGQQGTFVFVMKPDQTVELRPVQSDFEIEGKTVMKKGLNAGEQVVTSGQLRLIDGSKVKITEADTNAAPAGKAP